jgi:hypothetical protein
MFVFATEFETKQSIALNAKNILYIRDAPVGTKVYFNDSSYVIVLDNYLHLFNSLNNQKCDCC